MYIYDVLNTLQLSLEGEVVDPTKVKESPAKVDAHYK